MRQSFRPQTVRLRSGNAPSGFTLLEILIAFFIFAIVISVLFGSYRAIFGNIDAVARSGEHYEAARDCLNRVVQDLRQVHVVLRPRYFPPDMDDPPDPYRIEGDVPSVKGEAFSRLRFASGAHIAFEHPPREGIAQIVYYVQPTKADRLVLRRSDQLYPYDPFEEDERDPVLCEDIKSFTVSYYDQNGEIHDQWNSDDEAYGYATPSAVGIHLTVGDASFSRELKTLITLPVFRPESN